MSLYIDTNAACAARQMNQPPSTLSSLMMFQTTQNKLVEKLTMKAIHCQLSMIEIRDLLEYEENLQTIMRVVASIQHCKEHKESLSLEDKYRGAILHKLLQEELTQLMEKNNEIKQYFDKMCGGFAFITMQELIECARKQQEIFYAGL